MIDSHYRKVDIPMFEVVSNPTISMVELKDAMAKGDIGSVKITDTITGKTTTVKKMHKSFNKSLKKLGYDINGGLTR